MRFQVPADGRYNIYTVTTRERCSVHGGQVDPKIELADSNGTFSGFWECTSYGVCNDDRSLNTQCRYDASLRGVLLTAADTRLVRVTDFSGPGGPTSLHIAEEGVSGGALTTFTFV